MTRYRRQLSLLAFAILTTTVLSACGETKEEKEGSEDAETTETAAVPADSAAKADSLAVFMKEAKVAEADARATALKEVPGGTVTAFELEREDGKLIWSYDIKIAGKEGIEEIAIDAITGKMVAHEHETPKDEKKEAAEDAAKAPIKTM